jgi:hypothetical protein
MLEGVLIDQAMEVLCQRARDCGRSTGARSIPQALGPLMRKALHPLTQGRIRQVEGGGDGGDMVTRDHRMDGLGTAKAPRLLGLLAHGCSGRERMIGTVACEGAHRLAPWGRMTFISYVTHDEPCLMEAEWLRLKFSRFCL